MVASIIGGTLGCFFMYGLLYWVIFKRVLADPMKSRLTAAVLVLPSAVLLYSGLNDASIERSLITYALGWVLVTAYAFKEGGDEKRKRSEEGIFN